MLSYSNLNDRQCPWLHDCRFFRNVGRIVLQLSGKSSCLSNGLVGRIVICLRGESSWVPNGLVGRIVLYLWSESSWVENGWKMFRKKREGISWEQTHMWRIVWHPVSSWYFSINDVIYRCIVVFWSAFVAFSLQVTTRCSLLFAFNVGGWSSNPGPIWKKKQLENSP